MPQRTDLPLWPFFTSITILNPVGRALPDARAGFNNNCLSVLGGRVMRISGWVCQLEYILVGYACSRLAASIKGFLVGSAYPTEMYIRSPVFGGDFFAIISALGPPLLVDAKT